MSASMGTRASLHPAPAGMLVTAPTWPGTRRFCEAGAMGIVLLGPPGSGKGTQGTRLAAALGVQHLSTGDVLRAEVAGGTELGAQVGPYLESGELVPDDLLLAVVEHALAEAGAAGGYVLDGFPRTAAQVEHLPVDDLAIYLQ